MAEESNPQPPPNEQPPPAPEPTPEPPKPDALAQLMLERQDRVNRARADIVKVCERERVDIIVGGIDFVNGQVRGRVNIVPVDNMPA